MYTLLTQEITDQFCEAKLSMRKLNSGPALAILLLAALVAAEPLFAQTEVVDTLPGNVGPTQFDVDLTGYSTGCALTWAL